MENIRSFSVKQNNYTEKIRDSEFIEGNIQTEVNSHETFSSIVEIFIKMNEIEYCVLQKNQRQQFIKDTLLNLASNIQMDDINTKILSEKTLQANISQENIYFSTILYLNNYYKVNCIIFNKQTNKYYKTGLREYLGFICVYDNGHWYLEEKEISEDIIYSPLIDLKPFLTMDLSTNQIYKIPLKGIQNYKLAELEELALQNNIELKDKDNKKKRKKDLYEEINLKKIKQQPI
jgi:hypothetical protein